MLLFLLFSCQFWGEVEHVGLEALENEVAEKKRRHVSRSVAKACSIGAQMTLIMGGGALLFRWDGKLVVGRWTPPTLAEALACGTAAL